VGRWRGTLEGVGVIDGVVIKPLGRMVDERGSVMHMLRTDDPLFERFGEIYFSTVWPGAIKGWHLHTEMVLNYAVVAGQIKLVLYDDRDGSPTRGNVEEIFLGDDNYSLVRIPAFVWNGFKGVGTTKAVVANCATIPHRPDEIRRLDPITGGIPYIWDIKHR
jgi:dTDP-4-dehydrorhamnose 3,5-epimerase